MFPLTSPRCCDLERPDISVQNGMHAMIQTEKMLVLGARYLCVYATAFTQMKDAQLGHWSNYSVRTGTSKLSVLSLFIEFSNTPCPLLSTALLQDWSEGVAPSSGPLRTLRCGTCRGSQPPWLDSLQPRPRQFRLPLPSPSSRELHEVELWKIHNKVFSLVSSCVEVQVHSKIGAFFSLLACVPWLELSGSLARAQFPQLRRCHHEVVELGSHTSRTCLPHSNSYRTGLPTNPATAVLSSPEVGGSDLKHHYHTDTPAPTLYRPVEYLNWD